MKGEGSSEVVGGGGHMVWSEGGGISVISGIEGSTRILATG